MKNVLRVNMSTGQISTEPLPAQYERLAGRALSSRIIADEVPADCEPLGPRNKLAFTCGYFAGTSLTSAMRTSVGGKSPLTGTIKESNAGGTLSMKLALHGYRALSSRATSPTASCTSCTSPRTVRSCCPRRSTAARATSSWRKPSASASANARGSPASARPVRTI